MRSVDSLLVEALVETRSALADLGGVAAARPLRLRRVLVERAAEMIDLGSSPPDHVARVAAMCLDVRDQAVALLAAHRVVSDALREAMD